MTQLALTFGFKLYPRPKGIPETWSTKFCKSYLAQKYINPTDTMEWVVVKPPDSIGMEPYILHRTAQGFADARWFYEVAPQLENIVKDPTLGQPFSKDFNAGLNQLFDNKGRGMTPGQIQAINLFFDKYVPGLEGICSTCFKVMLPRGGAGERWLYRGDEKYEIRLSAAKKLSKFIGQQTEYVSQKSVNDVGEDIFALWDPKQCKLEYSMIMEQQHTHIPWVAYDFHKFNIRMPRCQCKKKLA